MLNRSAGQLAIACGLVVFVGCSSAHGPQGSSTPASVTAAVPSQQPSSGSPIPLPGTAYGPSLPPVAEIPVCGAHAYRIDADLNGAQGAVTLSAPIAFVSGGSCKVEGKVSGALEASSGELLPISGNPATAQVSVIVSREGDRILRPFSFAWRNWCSDSSLSYKLVVTGPLGQSASQSSSGLPFCVDPKQPSRLTPFADQ